TSGSFTVTGIGGFVSYGSAAAQGLPANLFGGQVKLKVSLDNGSSGLLTITCELGSPPPAHHEGITVIFGPGGAFPKKVSGTNVFIHSGSEKGTSAGGAAAPAEPALGPAGDDGRWSGGGGGAWCFGWLGFGDAAEGDFVAEGAELADELADLAVVVALE